jgi:hypothetical protein
MPQEMPDCPGLVFHGDRHLGKGDVWKHAPLAGKLTGF